MTNDAEEPRKHPAVAREYADGRITVSWSPELCIHTANCINALPDVFDPMRRPWIVLDGHDPDEVADAVISCPTGALRFERADGGPQEEAPAETIVQPRPNGPLFVVGRIRVVDAHGHVSYRATRLALCRCGGSGNKPYCDGTHRGNGFRA